MAIQYLLAEIYPDPTNPVETHISNILDTGYTDFYQLPTRSGPYFPHLYYVVLINDNGSYSTAVPTFEYVSGNVNVTGETANITVNLGNYTGNVATAVSILKIVFTNPASAGVQYGYKVASAALPTLNKNISVTTITPPEIAPEGILYPANISQAYSSQVPLSGLTDRVGTWTATGLPSGYNIDGVGTISAAASSTRTLTDATATVSVAISCKCKKIFFEELTKTATFRLFDVNTPPTAYYNAAYNGKFSVIGAYYPTEVETSYASSKIDVSSFGTFNSSFIPAERVIYLVSDGGVTSAGVRNVTVTIPVTKNSSNTSLIPTGYTTPFNITKTLTFTALETTANISVAPSLVETSYICGVSEVSPSVGIRLSYGTDSRYPWYNTSVVAITENSSGTVLNTQTVNSAEFIWIKPFGSLSKPVDGNYYLTFKRLITTGSSTTAYVASTPITITLNSAIDFNDNTTSVSDIVSGIGGSSTTLIPGSVVSDTLTVTVNANVKPNAGYFTKGATWPDDNLQLCDPSGIVSTSGQVFANSCQVKIKAGATLSATTEYSVAYYTFANGNVEGGRQRTVRISVDTLTIDAPAGNTLTAPINVAYTSAAFTVSGYATGLTWTATGLPTGLSFSGNTLTGTPTVAGTFNTTVIATHTSGATGRKTYTFTITPTTGNVSITSVSPAVFDKDVDVGKAFTITGTNFTTSPAMHATLYAEGAIGFGKVLTISSNNTTTINTTFPTGLAVGYYTLEVISGTGTNFTYKDRAIEVTSASSSISLTSVSATSLNAGATNVVFTLTGSGFGVDGTVGQVYFSDLGSPVNATVSNSGTTAVCTRTTELPVVGTAIDIYFKSFSGNSTGSKRVTTTAGDISSVKLVVNSVEIAGGLTEAAAAQVSPVVRGNSFTGSLLTVGGTSDYSYAISDGTLPINLGLSTSTISGSVDNAALSKKVSITVTDSSSTPKTKKVWFNFAVTGGTPVITSNQIFPVFKNGAISGTIQVSGGTPNFTFTKVSGSLPTGITLTTSGSSAGTFSGTCTAEPGDYVVTYTVTDSASPTPLTSAAVGITIRVNPPQSTPTITNISPSTGSTGGNTLVTLSVAGVTTGFAVKVDGADATIEESNLTLGYIKFRTPSSSAHTAKVKVVNVDEGTTPEVDFIYVTISVPVFSSLSEVDGPFAGGQKLTLYGSDFSSDMVVYINNVACDVWDSTYNTVYYSPTEARILTPAYTGSSAITSPVDVGIKLSNAAGEVTPSVVYTYRPPPTITAVTPSSGPSQGGITIYITGTNFFQRNGRQPRVFIGNVEIPADNVKLYE